MTLSTARERIVVATVGFMMLPLAVAGFLASMFVVMGYFAVAMFGGLFWTWFPGWGFIAMVLLSPVIAYPFVLFAKRLGRFIGEGS